MSFHFDRRTFLKFATGGAVGAASSGVSLTSLSELNAALSAEQVRVPSGPESWVPGVCGLCAGGCGLRVRLIGKRAVKIQGNPLHPVNHGGLCPKGLAALQELYHPDRLRQPLKNTGTREKPRWKEISWDEAIGTSAARLAELRNAGQAHTVVLVDRNRRGLLERFLRQFFYSYGSPNHLTMPSGLDALQTAAYWQQGVQQPLAFDLEHTRYLLSFGVDLLDGWGSPTTVMRAFGRWRDSASGRRAKFVQIGPRFAITAARADEWVALNPGMEATLALGIAYVLISEGLYDANFVRDHTFGFEDWSDAEGKPHIGFRTLVTSDYRLNAVAEKTGVPAETILRLAREAAQNRPAVAIGDWQTSTLAGNPFAAMAVHSLNALLGSIDVPGGVLVQQALPGSATEPRPPAQPALLETAGQAAPAPHIAQLPEAILARRPYPVRMLLLHQVNPVFSETCGAAFRQALTQVPFIVAFSPFMNESAALADLILPTPTMLETWQEAATPPTVANALHSISPPAVAPRHNSRASADVFLAWARALGGDVAKAVPFTSYEEYLRRQTDGIFAAQSGAVFSSSLEETWNRLMERSGWWTPSYATAEELFQQMQQQGGWWEPSYSYGEWDRVLRTPSGRFEFYPQILAKWVQAHPELMQKSATAGGQDRLLLPHQPPLAEPSSDKPLLLAPAEVLPLAGGEGAHLPYLQQIAGAHLFEHWESWLEIHPETAHRFGIHDGDLVWVESRRGRVQARARLYEGVQPGLVCLPLGYGHKTGPAWACRGANPLEIVEEQYEPFSGLPLVSGTWVKVYRS